jgi:hypothetical protein
MKAQYRILGHDWNDGGNWVLIEDLNGPMSVTNDAEAVVQDILLRGYLRSRILYRDSAGQWDELLHNGIEFTGFGPGYTPTVV